MRKRIKYTDEPMGDPRVIPNFLPPPERLIFKEEGVKVTMVLSRSSVDYFKRVAKKQHTPYQKMIRMLLDAYAAKHPRP
ncbi:MAG: CopG family transcriptional regulator [Elusimicrobia bacterium]|nr:CopG family transcriptional regulator [Elusimicrobiota bacterium]